MRFTPTIFGKLLEPIDRRRFRALVERHNGDAYDKSFSSWDHLLALLYAQLGGADSLRSLVAGWNANRHQHFHLGGHDLSRSTISDAGRRRPVALFAALFSSLSAALDRTTRRQGEELVHLIDSTPIPLGDICRWAVSNGRIRGLKLHVAYDPHADAPRVLDITQATVNDVTVGRTAAIEPGVTYVFDKGYCHYGWWTGIAKAGAVFVTRPKTNMRLAVSVHRPLAETEGDGFTVLDDAEVTLERTRNRPLPITLRRVHIRRNGGPGEGKTLTLITNDLTRSAVAIAALYKGRWQIELLFRWIKQHLNIRKFLGTTPNAIKLQILAALIAFALLRLAARTHRSTLPLLHFTILVARCLFERRTLGAINKPPPCNPSTARPPNPLQMAFIYS